MAENSAIFGRRFCQFLPLFSANFCHLAENSAEVADFSAEMAEKPAKVAEKPAKKWQKIVLDKFGWQKKCYILAENGRKWQKKVAENGRKWQKLIRKEFP